LDPDIHLQSLLIFLEGREVVGKSELAFIDVPRSDAQKVGVSWPSAGPGLAKINVGNNNRVWRRGGPSMDVFSLSGRLLSVDFLAGG